MTEAETTAAIDAFADEVDALAQIVDGLSAAGWERPTQFKSWSIRDVILHLYASDNIALLAVKSEADFRAMRAEILALRKQGLSMIEESRRRFPDLCGAALASAWGTQAHELAARLRAVPADARLPWSGPSMGVRMFVIARQMETWAHGQEIFDILGLERVNSGRIKNIAHLGVRTFGWTFSNRGLAVPQQRPVLALTAPSGRPWTWQGHEEAGEIEGSATAFCQVVTQVRNVADTDLVVRGEVATRWMALAQCFAGPPSDPPPAGTRFVLSKKKTSSGNIAAEDASC